MELHGLFVESESDDYVARVTASMVHKQIGYWLQANDDRLSRRMPSTADGGFILPSEMFDMDEDHPDLVVVFKPEITIPSAPGFGSKAGFGNDASGQKVIYIRCLMAPHDTTNLADRFRVGFKKSFIHEFQHYLLSYRKGPAETSSAAMDRGGVAAYFNDADETNAYYMEAVHDVMEFFQSVRANHPQTLRRFSDMTTVELIAWAKKKFFFDAFLSHASPKTTQALNKRLYRFIEQSVRPMMASVLRNYED